MTHHHAYPVAKYQIAARKETAEHQVAVGQSRDAVPVWARSNGLNDIVQAATRPAGGSFGAPVSLGPRPECLLAARGDRSRRRHGCRVEALQQQRAGGDDAATPPRSQP
jgi:hypothetical protein